MLKTFAALVLLALPLCARADDKLVFALDVIRHGDRTPITDIPAAPAVWPEGAGQLTARGMRREYDLGRAMREEYVDRYHLLASTYTVGTLFIRSSDLDRTLMSAQCVLAGLYPHGTGPLDADDGKPALPDFAQPIPVHTVDQDSEPYLFPDTPKHDFGEIVKKYATAAWKTKDAELRPDYERWSKLSGMKINGLEDLIGLGDALFIRQRYNVPPPAGFKAEEIATIIKTGHWIFTERYRPAETGVGGLALLREMASKIKDAADGKTSLKYALYSAHDSTLAVEMSTLGDPQDEQPPYSSRINVELFDSPEKGKIVKVKYNGAPSHVKGCAADYCTLEQFLALAK